MCFLFRAAPGADWAVYFQGLGPSFHAGGQFSSLSSRHTEEKEMSNIPE